MSRGPRLFINNAIYHLMARGNQKQETFKCKEDFQKYFELLKHFKKKYAYKLYCYCLMPNHVHLVLEIKIGRDLGKIMQGLNQTYTMWFNEKYKKVGHLWQGRYKSMIIQKNKYLLDCIEYVELNPVRAKIVESPLHYPWSSLKDRLNYANNGILDELELTE